MKKKKKNQNQIKKKKNIKIIEIIQGLDLGQDQDIEEKDHFQKNSIN